MTTILVVDDAAVDRRLVGELLAKDPDLDVEFAVHGVEALEYMKRRLPELVVTDLVMPEMDGLELVGAIRRDYPLAPVILMTSKGSEEIAVKALQQGAASYVPKRTLARQLLDTIHNVLAVSARKREHSRLMQCMAKNECTFVLDNDTALFAPLVTFLQEGVARMGLCDEMDCTRLGVALEEALANALYHGNLEVGSALHEDNGRNCFALVEQRTREAPYEDRRIYVKAKLSRDGAVFVLRDDGAGFDPTALPDPTDPANLERASGRGVLLMKTFMDEVIYNDLGNSVTLVKYRNYKVNSPNHEDS